MSYDNFLPIRVSSSCKQLWETCKIEQTLHLFILGINNQAFVKSLQELLWISSWALALSVPFKVVHQYLKQ